MKIKILKDRIADPQSFIRRCGYGRIVDRKTGEISYSRRLRGSLYPRFHVYIEEKDGHYFFNLHLDQRPARYKGVTAHSGEYGGELVVKEAELIKKYSICA